MDAPTISGCTIADVAALPQAIALAESFHRYHRDATFTVLLTDAFPLRADNFAFHLLTLNDLPWRPEDAHRLPKRYAPHELALALRPWLLQDQLSRGASRVILFHPTIEVLAPLNDLAPLIDEYEAVLVQRYGSSAGGAVEADRSEQLRHEPGFVAAGAKGAAFIEWWLTSVRADTAAERSIDRTIFERIPASLATTVLSDLGWNIGYWNLAARPLTRGAGGYSVNGMPARFFNFAGYDIANPHLLSTYQGHSPQVLLSDSPALETLCRSYAERVHAAQQALQETHPAGVSVTPGGFRVDRYMARLHSQARTRFEMKAGPPPPDIGSPVGEQSFIKWLNQRMMEGQPAITRYMLAVHTARPDLQAAFPEPLGADTSAFHRWFLDCGIAEEQVPSELQPHNPLAPRSIVEEPAVVSSPAIVSAVNVVGYLNGEFGLGEAARLLISALEAAGIPFMTTVYDRTESRQQHAFNSDPITHPVDIDIICINADQLPAFAESDSWKHDRYKIGVWFWEVDEFPVAFDAAFDLVDEIWVASTFVQDAISKASPKPVFKFHLPIVPPEVDASLTRSSLRLPDRFSFLFSFDFLSVLERKNPLGLIEAFQHAFRPGEGPALVLKTINSQHRVREMEKLKFAIAHHPDITLLDGYFSPIEKNTVSALSDCYISLHRSEGFGLTMAEAMAFAKPVIATGYSGNLEFMNDENSFLCRYAETSVGNEGAPYPPTAHWAEPDLAHAADLMRKVFIDRDEACNRGRVAADDVQRRHSPSLAGKVIGARLAAIRRHRRRHAQRSADVT